MALAEFKQQGNEATRRRGSFCVRYVWLTPAFGSVSNFSYGFLIDTALNSTAQNPSDLRREVTARSYHSLKNSIHHTPPL